MNADYLTLLVALISLARELVALMSQKHEAKHRQRKPGSN